ncbi:hypothetical protein PC129_g2329 [Phytophthora cactorum]|uniref:Retroviral polymerase SH3-like domain-containing protein n=1 Tax=Phytophthora cactorum TaxID=29920 RepID=A0A8T1LVC6_9STRA|nr:hypothetical protein Pcac1_g11070 [Phytophthora cactorum]KAG2840532.1 hypothetical protein PC111_g3460 [Phytophthora cactorum]KAG2869242.1 hypothetical protein PC113_g365 [Phytophthora cactorum]KAG2936284.1 hypothetical protein PC114_g204 [Phytophthora cactorum]KAG2998767.1 hypothetical protein PC118_g1160 [Phytophthora cactorum]
MSYKDGVKGYRVQNVETGKVQIVRTVKFVETTSPWHLVTHREEADVLDTSTVLTLSSLHPGDVTQIVSVEVEAGDMIPLQRDVSVNDSIVPYGSTHYMITRSRTRHIDETMNPEETGARKEQVVASYEVATMRRRMTQERPKSKDQQLAIYESGQVMAATEEAPKSYIEATTDADSAE